MKNLHVILLSLLFFFGCKESEPTTTGNPSANTNTGSNPTVTGGSNTGGGGSSSGNNSTEWLIPSSEVYDGGPGKDGIPALESSEFLNVSSVNYLNDDDLIIGYMSNGFILAYPHIILDWHEIANENIGGGLIAINYCPLTGTGMAWERVINNTETTFGVSGLLYNSNLIPYDRLTDSNWSQMRLDCVNGSLSGTEINTFHVIETTWVNWKTMYPDTRVLSTNTGHSRPYGEYPYGDYKTNHDLLLFPISPDDTRLNRKERVHGVIIKDLAKVYRFSSFTPAVKVIEDTFQNQKIVVVGSTSRNFIVSYLVPGGLTFNAVDENDIIMTDNEGNKWDFFGNAVDGPRAGEQLTPTSSFIGYWFAWGAFYPGCDIYGL